MDKQEKRVRRRSKKTIFSGLLRAQWRYGRQTVAIIDADDTKTTYATILRGAFGLGHAIARQTKRGENVGVFLPTSTGALIAFFAVLAFGRVPAMLNFTAGDRNLKSALRAAGVKKILTAHRFIDMVELHGLVKSLEEDAEFLYLEDVRESLTLTDKIAAVAGPFVPVLMRINARSSAPGVILFTSGTEGHPKGVVLNHSNVVANVEQIDAHVTLKPGDIFFNPLPTFHCYGLTAGALWPILKGHPLVLHPSPLQVKIIPERIKATGATVLFATDTFLSQYTRADRHDNLTSLRIAVCGAERVRDETRALVEKRFGMEVLEGYGVTEAAPVVAANQPGDIRAGTVGKLLPGMTARLEPVEGLDGAGRLFIKGPNVMAGYLREENPGVIEALEDGWYDTGDVVSIDEDGYVAIRGRVKRFAKIGGEMVSLTVIENCASALWPDHQHIAVALPDERKGEQIILMSECPTAERPRLLTWMQSHGVSELTLPRKIFHTEAIPVLGTGKTDLGAVHQMALDHLETPPAAKSETSEGNDGEPDTPDAKEPGKETAIEEKAGPEAVKEKAAEANDAPHTVTGEDGESAEKPQQPAS